MSNAPTCVCKKPMVERRRKIDGHLFWGCSQYPVCDFTLASHGDPEEHENGCPFDAFLEDGDPAGDSC